MAKILVVDDDPHLRQLMEVSLRRAGFETVLASNGEYAWELLGEKKIDLVLLDIMMPDMDGWTLCRRIRDAMELPIVMLTALGETPQKIHGLQLGADDYLTKPFDPDELVARITAVLRRFRINASRQLVMGSLRLDAENRQVILNDQDLMLPPKEFLLLFHLASYPGQTLLREQLIEEIWGYDFSGDERTLDVHIKRLREKFSGDDAPFVIRTIRGLGYRLEVRT